jgi:hypothetical protein
MSKTLAHNLRALLCLSEDERALQIRLDKVADAFGAPWCGRRVKPLDGFNIAGDCEMRRRAIAVFGANIGMRCLGLARTTLSAAFRSLALDSCCDRAGTPFTYQLVGIASIGANSETWSVCHR